MGSPTSNRSEVVPSTIALKVIQEDAGRGAAVASRQVKGASGLTATAAPRVVSVCRKVARWKCVVSTEAAPTGAGLEAPLPGGSGLPGQASRLEASGAGAITRRGGAVGGVLRANLEPRRGYETATSPHPASTEPGRTAQAEPAVKRGADVRHSVGPSLHDGDKGTDGVSARNRPARRFSPVASRHSSRDKIVSPAGPPLRSGPFGVQAEPPPVWGVASRRDGPERPGRPRRCRAPPRPSPPTPATPS